MTPSLTEFDPRPIPFQHNVIKSVRKDFDYSTGVQEILLSGSVGSSKSVLMAHLAVTHCLFNKRAHFGIGRLSMPALKGTLFSTICEHIDGVLPCRIVENQAKIFFPNGSKITGHSWQDKRYKKVRSYEFSGFAIEELTENDSDAAYKEILMRVGRSNTIKEKILVSATNPDDPSHWVYDRFFIDNHAQRHVFLSNTFDNPFLPKSYVEDLRKNLSTREARRMLYGEWIELSRDVIYYEYKPEIHYTTDKYEPNPSYPIYWTHDFNIGVGKPMSSCLFQYINDTFLVFAEIVVQGARTNDICDEALERGLIKNPYRYIITGDASGKSRDTRSKTSDYEIIQNFFKHIPDAPRFELNVPLSNPAVRKRHNMVNGYLMNDLGQSRIKIFNCKTLDKGMRLTKLKDGGDYIEDDSKEYQHVTTALGYGINTAKGYNQTKAAVYQR
jgi:hypothetical protein